jgi:periplasmic protein TonB
MQTNNILSAPLIDLIFDGRNKEYGAYELRRSYAKRINKALFITATIAGLAFGGAVLGNSLKKDPTRFNIGPGIEIIEIPDDKKPDKLPDPVKPKPQEVQVKTQMFTEPEIVDKEELETPPPNQDDLLNAKIDVFTQEGVIDDRIAGPESIGEGTGIIEKKLEKDPDEIYRTVEIDAEYKGNWHTFLERNLNGNVPTDNNAPPGTYTIVIQFVVDKEGNVSDLKALTNHGYGMEQECIRALKKASKWEPAIQNGYPVKAYRKQPITFQVMEE